MSNREKTLVGLMLLAVVYGIYTLFLASPQQTDGGKGGREQKSLNQFIIQIAQKTNTAATGDQGYILKKAQQDWQRDPLARIASEKSDDADRQWNMLKSALVYTGFLQMGDKRLAIINGTEYESGDLLEPGGYVIRRIYPDHVVISARSGNKKPITLPMEETE